ncbi:MAG: alpha-L-fucosidase [Spirochaetota bacterium]
MSISPVAPFGALPSARQLAWHRLEYYGFVHFTTNTFTDLEWGYGDEKPLIFDPSACSPKQWARAAHEAGMKGLILTCKHHDGFCLWPSKFTEHSVKASPYKNGKGDIVREFFDACAEYGLKTGVYLSPWDRNHPDYAKPEYITYYRNQLRELLTNYGDVFEVWFDGANGGDGYYGGAREKRFIDKEHYYDWANTHALVRGLAPNAVMFSDAGPDIRWVGNESGFAAETMWCTMNMEGRYPGYHPEGYNPFNDLGYGHENGTTWLPPEVDVSIRPGWFWHERQNAEVRSVANLLAMYYESVGRGATLLLNIPPDRRGLFHEIDVERLAGFRAARDAVFKTDVVLGAALTAKNVRGNDRRFAVKNLIDGNDGTYWATDDGVTASSIDIVFPSPTTVNNLLIQEYIALGQRVTSWKLEAETASGFTPVTQGTTIGYKRLARFSDITARRFRVRIEAKAPIVLSRIGLFHAPVFLEDPLIARDRNGAVSISAGSAARVRYTLNGRTPDAASPIFEKPVSLSEGGLVRAAVFPADNPGAMSLGKATTLEKRFGYAKKDWRVVRASSAETQYDNKAENAIDDDPKTIWHTKWSGGTPLPPPHEIIIDLGKPLAIGAFGYLPRQDGHGGALAEIYLFGVSDDGVSWKKAAGGRFDNIVNNPVLQVVPLKKPLSARYIKFTVVTSAGDHASACAAEIDVFPPERQASAKTPEKERKAAVTAHAGKKRASASPKKKGVRRTAAKERATQKKRKSIRQKPVHKKARRK